MELIDKIEKLLNHGMPADLVAEIARRELGMRSTARQQELPLAPIARPKPATNAAVVVAPVADFDAVHEVNQFGGEAYRIYAVEGKAGRVQRNAANKLAARLHRKTPSGTHAEVNRNYSETWEAVRKMPSPKAFIDLLDRARGAMTVADFSRDMLTRRVVSASYHHVRAWFEGSLLPSEQEMSAIAEAYNIPEAEAAETYRRAASVHSILRARIGMRTIKKKEV